jgi:hypothetical protein
LRRSKRRGCSVTLTSPIARPSRLPPPSPAELVVEGVRSHHHKPASLQYLSKYIASEHGSCTHSALLKAIHKLTDAGTLRREKASYVLTAVRGWGGWWWADVGTGRRAGGVTAALTTRTHSPMSLPTPRPSHHEQAASPVKHAGGKKTAAASAKKPASSAKKVRLRVAGAGGVHPSRRCCAAAPLRGTLAGCVALHTPPTRQHHDHRHHTPVPPLPAQAAAPKTPATKAKASPATKGGAAATTGKKKAANTSARKTKPAASSSTAAKGKARTPPKSRAAAGGKKAAAGGAKKKAAAPKKGGKAAGGKKGGKAAAAANGGDDVEAGEGGAGGGDQAVHDAAAAVLGLPPGDLDAVVIAAVEAAVPELHHDAA